MRYTILSAVMVLALGAGCIAQVTVPNQACGPVQSSTTVGSLLTLDSSGLNARIGAGSLALATGPANASYLPTGWAIQPAGPNGSLGSPPGFTIQFWCKPTAVAPTNLAYYMLGDASWVGVNGAFRMFAHGIAGVNQVVLRGPLNQLASLGQPLSPGVLALNGGWVHMAWVYNATSGLLSLYVNGALDNSVGAGITGTGTNLTICGYNGSSSGNIPGHYDELRFYDWARTAFDIAADLNVPAGSCSAPIVVAGGDWSTPTQGYYDFEASQSDHVAHIGVNTEGSDSRTRLFTDGTTLTWGATSTVAPFPGTNIMNLNGPIVATTGLANARTAAYQPPPAMPAAHVTPGLTALQVGHGYSAPAAVFSVAWADGLGLGGLIPGLFTFSLPLPFVYNGPDNFLTVPAGAFNPGDRIDIQTIAPDATWPSFLGVTNRTTFAYVAPNPGAHFHFESRGVDVIQVAGFWEVWNTGSVDITRVVLDLSTVTPTAKTWAPTGQLNSGGTLATGDSYRWLTHQHTGVLPYTLVSPSVLQFDFGTFTANIDHFAWDCSTTPTGSGATFVGATCTVTFADTTVLTGQLAVDPFDPQGAILDL